jgi:glycosyltransferase involved in cell wall biosynthesis
MTIVGAGPEYDALKELIVKHSLQNNITLTGALKQKQVAEMMQDHDAFLFPSIRELGAGAVVEAMACGLPCIAVDYGAPGSLLSDGRGELVPMGNREQILQHFIRAMKTYIAEPGTRVKHASKASRYVQENLSWKMKAKKFAKIYEAVVA